MHYHTRYKVCTRTHTIRRVTQLTSFDFSKHTEAPGLPMRTGDTPVIVCHSNLLALKQTLIHHLQYSSIHIFI
jgi:hypothetical protein